jgi:hypothetical protein
MSGPRTLSGPWTADNPLPVTQVAGPPPNVEGWYPPTVESPLPVYIVGTGGEGGVTIPSAALLGGNGSVLGAVSLGTNLSLSGTFPIQTLNAAAGGGGGGLSGMTAGQLPIAATATTVTSSVPYGTSGNSTIVETNASGNLVAAVMPAYSGDVTSPAGSIVNTLATVNGNVGTFQGLTLDGKGRVTAAVNQNYATVAALAAYAPIASPTFTGTPAAPTATAGTNTTQLATTAFANAAAAAAPNQPITLTGDVTGSGAGSFAATISVAAVTYAKMQNVTTARLLGNPTGAAAAPSEITLGTNLSFSGGVLNATGGGNTPSVSWLAGANPNNAVLLIANRAMTITGISGVPTVAGGGTVVVKNGFGTAVHSGNFNANGTVNTVQPLTVTVTTLAAGDFLYLSTSGTWTSSLSVGNITVYLA